MCRKSHIERDTRVEFLKNRSAVLAWELLEWLKRPGDHPEGVARGGKR
jgi:hypothetical protein